MTPTATAANGFARRLEPSRFIINASLPAAAAARRFPWPLYPSAFRATWPSGAQQHQRRNAYSISPNTPFSDIFGLDSTPDRAPEARVTPEVAEAQPQSQGHEYTPFDSPHTRTRNRTWTIDYKKKLPSALRAREIDKVFQCMLAGAHDVDFVSSVPPVTFTAILQLIVSSNESEHMQKTLDHSWWMRDPCFPSLNASMAEFLEAAHHMVAIRRQANMALGLADYRLLLTCAADASDKPAALDLWNDMKQDKLVPDTECYNALMQAILWDRHMGDRSWRHPLSWKVDNYYFGARETGILPYSPPVGGYAAQVKALFDELLCTDGVGDETTVLHLITAYAREGNLMGVKDILRRVWNIHVDELVATGAQGSPPKPLPATSPMRPTSRLVYTIVHAFGINAEVPVALRLTDFLSTAYGLEMPATVWSELLTWTYVQSMIRSGRSKTTHRVAKQLPLGATERLWQTLTKPPYCVRPSMKMFHLSVNSLTRWQRHHLALPRIREGVELYRSHHRAVRVALRELRKAEAAVAGGRAPERSLSGFVRTCNAAAMVAKRDREMIRHWCTMYLKRGFGYGFTDEYVHEDGTVRRYRRLMRETQPDWAETVPAFVDEFREFLPNWVEYRTLTGKVELELAPAVPVWCYLV